MTRSYSIIETVELCKVDFKEICETSSATIIRNVDGTKTLIKWDGPNPTFFPELTSLEGPYTNDEIKIILETEAWFKEEEEEEEELGDPI